MKLNQYMLEEKWLLGQFRDYWLWGQQKDEENFPKEMDEGAWREQFQSWLLSKDCENTRNGKK